MAATPTADVFAAGYDLLARVYLGGPKAAQPEALPALGPFLGSLGKVDPAWSATVEALLPGAGTDLDRAQQAYLECLALPLPGRHVPPYASVYLDGGTLWGPSTFAVMRHCEAEGLSWDPDRAGPGGTRLVAPDHVGVEMAFLAVTSARPTGGPAGVARLARLRWFLGHMAAWLPQLAEALGSPGHAGTLRGWTTWAAEVVTADLRRRGATEI